MYEFESSSPVVERSRDAAPLDISGAISRFARRASYEIAARDVEALERAKHLIPAGAPIFISWMPGDSDADRIAMARAVRAAGFTPTPHISVRRLAADHDVAGLIRRLRDEAGVDTLLVIGGDAPKPEGRYGAVADLMRDIDLRALGVRGIGLAGHPEEHPAAPPEVMERALDEKLELAARQGLNAFIATQFAFEAGPMVDWLAALRGRWPDVPVRVGLAGPASLRTLLRFAKVCGVGNSMRALTKFGGSLTRMLAIAGPDAVIRDLLRANDQDALGPIAPHLFCFGGLDRTARWMGAVAEGRFILDDDDGAGFRLLESES